jgi:hypothetical protein
MKFQSQDSHAYYSIVRRLDLYLIRWPQPRPLTSTHFFTPSLTKVHPSQATPDVYFCTYSRISRPVFASASHFHLLVVPTGLNKLDCVCAVEWICRICSKFYIIENSDLAWSARVRNKNINKRTWSIFSRQNFS